MDNPPANVNMIGIIGGGAAGMSCALWLKHLGYTPVIIDQNLQLGGQLRNLHRLNRWVLGHPQQTSAELAEIYADHIRQEAISCFFESQIVAINSTAEGFRVELKQVQTPINLDFRALVIATGVRIIGPECFADTLGFPSLYQAGGIGFFPIGHLDELPQLAGKTVAVLGGGDNAYFTAKDVALAGAKVHLLIRSQPKARTPIRKSVEALIAEGKIIEHLEIQVSSFAQGTNGITLGLQNGQRLIVDKVFARLGFAPNSEFLDNFSALHGLAKASGYITTDADKRTSISRVYAIGDVANLTHQSVVNAIAEGAMAAQDLSKRI